MKKFSIITAILMVFTVSTLALAGPGPRLGLSDLNPDVLKALDLSSKQTEEINTLVDAGTKQMTPLKAKLATKRAELALLWAQPTLDAQKIKATQKENQDLRNKIRDIRTDMIIAVRNLLTPEQTSVLLATGHSKTFRFKGRAGTGMGPKSGSGRGNK